MDNTSINNRGTMRQRGNVWSINNALVEEVSANTRRSGYIVVSYAVRERNNVNRIELLRLNVDRDTDITNQFGQRVDLSNIRKGMWVDAEFSPAMTRSIPPQTIAYRIIVRQRVIPPMPPPPPPPPPREQTTTGRVLRVDRRNNMLTLGNRV